MQFSPWKCYNCRHDSWDQSIMKELTSHAILCKPINNQRCHLKGMETVAHQRRITLLLTEIHQGPDQLYPDSAAQLSSSRAP